MKLFNEILTTKHLKLLENLKNNEIYFAHLRSNKKENLSEHTALVMEYCCQLIKDVKLEGIINNIIEKDVVTIFGRKDIDLQNFVKTMFVATIYFHDFGKVNPNFQREKMNNSSFPRINNGIGSDHSILSYYLYLSYFFNEIQQSSFNDKEKFFLFTNVVILSHSIYKHHGVIDNAFEPHINNILLDNFEFYTKLFSEISFVDKEFLKNLLTHYENLSNFKSDYSDISAGFILLKLNSSLLTASDYLATNEFMIGIKTNDFGLLGTEIKSKIINGVKNIPYNTILYENYDFFNSLNFSELQSFSAENLNLLRQKLSAEVVANFRKNKNRKLFYIEAPTGSGKTNLSLLLISEILKERKEINKIFYVFPFISLITQNFDEFKKNLNLSNKEIVQIHSKSSIENRESDDNYGSEKKNYIDALFLNFPFVLLSHIKFFNSIVSNDKEENYLFHRLANSVVILDELQSYTPSEWDKLNFLINTFSEALNITFVLMSATLPKISQLVADNSQDNFVYLVENKANYFNNPNFSQRVKFNFDYLENDSTDFNNEDFADFVLKKSIDYFIKNNKVHSLIEFMTKKSAKSFFEFVRGSDSFTDFEILFIDGTVLETRRIEIIDYLKSDFKNDKILIVATQVIEAGLNLDMDIGFKDVSLIDSDEQFAGRVNRNATKQNSVVYLFNSGNAKFVYKSDLRFIEQQKFNRNQLNKVLISKEFDDYYSSVFNNIISFNKQSFAENLSSFFYYLKMLKYSEVRYKFKLIDGKTTSVFVPLQISKIYFSENELFFLSQNNINPNKNNSICGDQIFMMYQMLVQKKSENEDFLQKKAEFKILSAVMSKFVFNSYFNSTTSGFLRNYGEEIYGYFYLTYWDKIYTYENGLNSDLETDINFI